MNVPYEIAEKTFSIGVAAPVDGALLPVKQHIILGSKKKMMIDTGPAFVAKATIEALSQVMNPQELDYIFLSHMDADHSD